MARVSLVIRDIEKNDGIASAAEESFLAFLGNIQKHHASKRLNLLQRKIPPQK